MSSGAGLRQVASALGGGPGFEASRVGSSWLMLTHDILKLGHQIVERCRCWATSESVAVDHPGGMQVRASG